MSRPIEISTSGDGIVIRIGSDDLSFVPAWMLLFWVGDPLLRPAPAHQSLRLSGVGFEHPYLAAATLLVWVGGALLFLLSLGRGLLKYRCELRADSLWLRTQLFGVGRTRRCARSDIRRVRTDVRDWSGRGGLRGTLVRVVLETDQGDDRFFPARLSVLDATRIAEALSHWIGEASTK